MGQNERTNAASLYGLARVQRERRWIGIMDAVLAFAIVGWVLSLTAPDLVPPHTGWVLPAVVVLAGTHRALVTLERHRRRNLGLGVRREVPQATRVGSTIHRTAA